ncbi:hypothetical protein A2661_00655 [Candidatus Giovannonibacteria bacterium RIFCSPHIGHO2_01_FULL_45_24]|uniref:Glycosyltransferase n=1 Tax=Candidatus Giovannonibacteria bacterium RIFCSPLOWO2_01_FULL_46_32 TaxID=1798353 RepID=A0A1F5XGT8_9BACT|nr:MAG: hypothetical protein A2661_00655 [Candidatus Giovannonibacteria bacterium RIFCSPHIGHO2_01_FULL_45_24]OGF87087.1 MAG: hypothetical protein A3B19_01495 [Candidatus Giovannonibacteria bacterium RIFCSPLOWO2_01_FULL_46_32]
MKDELKKPVIFVFSTAYLPFIGGAEVAIEQVAKRLKDRFDFIIFTSSMRRDLPKREVRDEGLVVRVGFGNRFDKFWLLFFGWFRVLREAKKHRGRIIFWVVDFSFGAATAGLLKVFYSKIPLVFTIQYGYGEERVTKGRLGLMNLAFRLILMQADYVTAISNYLLNLCKQYGYIGDGAVIHNGVDIRKFQNLNSKFQANFKTIITVGRLVPKNGVDILIKAVAELKKDTLAVKLHIIGDGPERKRLEHMTYGLKLKADVEFFDEVPYDDLPKCLAQADVFARPSRSEGMGNAFVEALAAGLPIIGTPVGGISDIIKDGETGLFAKVDDPKDLAGKIKILLEDRALVQKIIANGRKMIEERFSWGKIAKNYADIFNHEFNIKKRVLIATGIFPPEVGGPATYSKTLLDELPKKNFGARILNFRSVRRWPKIIRHFIYGLKLMACGRNADIIFAQDPASVGLPAALAAKILRKKFLLKIVGDYAWEQGVQRFGVKEVLDDFSKNKYRWEVELLRKIQKFVANRAEKVIVPSEYLKKVVTAWGVNPKKIHVIYNAFDFEGAGHQLRRPTSKLIVSAGRLVPWKGFDALLEIMPEILKEAPDAKLVIVGDGPEHEKLKLQITNYKLQKTVILAGNLPREKVLEYLCTADIFTLNTAYEGFSHQILEAMALGVPIVTTDAGGNPELIENNKEGFLVKFNDKEALKTKILDILKNPEFAKKLSEAASQKSSEFSKERMINKTIKILL